MNDLVATLRAMPPFQQLDREQLEWLAARGTVEHVPGGRQLYSPGPEEYEALWLLIEGEIVVLEPRAGGQEIEAACASHAGAWAGAVPGAGATSYGLTARTTRDSTLFRVPREHVDEMMRRGYPIAAHFLSGLRRGTRNLEAMRQQQQKLESLGKLAAGLAHEMNNPAAAARRAAGDMRRLLSRLAEQSAGDGLRELLDDARALEPRASMKPLERSDREERVISWLEARGIDDAWDLGPELVDVGVDVGWLEEAVARVPGDLAGGLRWLTLTLAADRLLDEIDDGLERISDLVGNMKEYTYMDRTPVQDVDLRRSIETTLNILKHKLAGIDVEVDLPADLPQIEAYGSELNLVWTNLLDNAADALNSKGHIAIRGRVEGEHVVIDVVDDGPGIPEDVQARIFDAFFTTKDVGKGLGLGLETVQRIVVRRHGGNIKVESRPGETRFSVRLPMRLKQPT